MRISSISFFNDTRVENNHNDYTQNKFLILRKPLPRDTVSFSGSSIMTGKDFKKLSRYMTDLYTGGPMLESETLTEMKTQGYFRGPIKKVVQILKQYKIYLDNNELKIFELIEESAKENPKLNLTELFNSWYLKSRANLRKKQQPIFDEIKTLGAQLPKEHIQPFYDFMQKTDRKLYDEPIQQKFSMKEFVYKAEKLIDKISGSNCKRQMLKLLQLLSDTNPKENNKRLSEGLIKNVFGFKDNVKIIGKKKSSSYNNFFNLYETKPEMVQTKIIETIRNLAEAQGYKKIAQLCNSNIDMLNAKTVRIPFSNKTFVYDLSEILHDVPDKELTKQIMELSYKLPTSSENLDAFILKLNNADPDVIGDRLFNPSLVSIEHMKAKSKGGQDLMINCALAKRGINAMRGNEPLYVYLSKFPIENQYKYAQNLVKLNHSGEIGYEDALGHLQTLEKEGRIDLSKYKAQLNNIENSKIAMFKTKFNKYKQM